MVEVFDFFDLYVLNLQENKWFLHFASPSNDENLWIECATLFPYVKKYYPIKTFQVIKIHDIFEIDFYVKKYMFCYGIENVRGGSYVDEILNEHLIYSLNKELESNKDTYFARQYIIDCVCKKYKTIKDIEKEKELAQIDLLNYRELCKTIEVVSCGKKLNRKLFDDIEWIYSHIIYVITETPDKLRKEDGFKYKDILNKFKLVVDVFTKFFGNPLKFKNSVLLYHPEFIFDYYFYHSHNSYGRQRCIHESHEAYKTLEYFEYMCYFIINRLEEFEFDLTTYPDNHGDFLNYSIEYLENIVT
jgi:hypothetical protein